MSIASRTFGRAFGLPRASTHAVDVHSGLSVRMRDGTILRTDHYAPRQADAPAVLVRTPYGRNWRVRLVSRAMAEQGFHVVVQSCRGTADSAGEFEPMLHERDDGLDTVDWIRRQPWYAGSFATFGPSYAGFVQWAIAADAGPDLKALATAVTAAEFGHSTYAGGSFALDTVLTWSALLAAARGPRLANQVELRRGQPKLNRGLAHPVLTEADAIATGSAVQFFRQWLAEGGPDRAYWSQRGHAGRLGEVSAPVLMVGGWQDIFLPWQLADYRALRAAGARPYLTIGSWHHGSLGLYRDSLRESIQWMRAHLYGEAHPLRATPVRVHIGGTRHWRDFADWPPPARTTDWFLRSGGGLSRSAPGAGAPDRFVYDPACPTPAVGGARLAGHLAGVRDNRALEARADVLTYTSDPLAYPIEVAGPVRATVFVRSSLPYFDVFVRLCDVRPNGRSDNVCDGLLRVAPGNPDAAGGVRPVEVDLWPTAYRFAAGNRLRVQISGGAHPRFARNPGTGAPLGAAGPLRSSVREVFATDTYPSAIHLPVLT